MTFSKKENNSEIEITKTVNPNENQPELKKTKPTDPNEKIFRYTIREGDIPADVFQEQAKFNANDTLSLIKSAEEVYDFSNLKSSRFKNEVKFYFLYHFKEELLKYNSLSVMGSALSHLSNCINVNTLLDIDIDRTNIKWKLYFINQGIKYKGKTNSNYFAFINNLMSFIHDFYDDRDETDKDIWDIKNIRGARIPASGLSNPTLDFSSIPQYYRNVIKNYLKTIITKRSASHCFQNLRRIKYFIKSFYSRGYFDGFIEQLNRQDIEDYLYHLNNEFRDNNPTYRSKFVSYLRTFLEYIQLAQYKKAPKKEVSFLIFQDDIPRRELNKDEVKKAKFIPEPVMKQLDNNIRALDRPQYIPFYILLRETGWRGTDILNLRYNNCLKRFWNKKEEKYNNQLCGDITKTGIANLKIPIRDQVAEMLDTCIKKTKKRVMIIIILKNICLTCIKVQEKQDL
jgi:hypothetical protein